MSNIHIYESNLILTFFCHQSIISAKASQFMGFAQHDAQEFMAFLLDGLHEVSYPTPVCNSHHYSSNLLESHHSSTPNPTPLCNSHHYSFNPPKSHLTPTPILHEVSHPTPVCNSHHYSPSPPKPHPHPLSCVR